MLKLHQYQINALINLSKALIFIVPSTLYLRNISKKKIELKNIDDINKYLNEKYKSEAHINFFQGIGSIVLALKLFYFFKPNATEKSLSLLYKYLSDNYLIEKSLFNTYKSMNPSILYT